MSSKPVHLNSVNGHHYPRQAIWEVIRERREFTVLDIEERTRQPLDTIRCYLTGLTRAGFLEHVEGKQRERGADRWKTGRWRLARDVGVDAPRVNKNGEETTLGCVREQLWWTMRILGTFTTADLAVHASTERCPVSRRSAKEYLRHLRKAGYVVKHQSASPWRLVRNTGPKPPIVQDVPQLFDQNLGAVVWRGGKS